MAAWADERMDGRNRWIDEQIKGRTDGQMN